MRIFSSIVLILSVISVYISWTFVSDSTTLLSDNKYISVPFAMCLTAFLAFISIPFFSYSFGLIAPKLSYVLSFTLFSCAIFFYYQSSIIMPSKVDPEGIEGLGKFAISLFATMFLVNGFAWFAGGYIGSKNNTDKNTNF